MKFKKYKVTFVDVLQAKNYADAYDQLRRSFLGTVDENGWMHDVDVFEFKEYKGTKWIGADRYETKEELRKRINKLITMLKNLNEDNIAIVSHNSFLKQMIFGNIGDVSNQLKHCHPYKFDIS